ncbi:MAG TPA: ketopantoate reductase family protein [Stellaceae bacterium]|jgi:2-dehydropantoate 2-reductase|nr:ketopantoate reductase family protein [Stellaceae bacterium]
MRILVLGAGAVGGYFGGRLAEAGRDVTFLVRGARAALLGESGLTVHSPLGDFHVPAVVTTAETLSGPYDLVMLTAKHYDLDAAIAAVRPAVGRDTVVLPLLNGLGHLDRLEAAFGADRVFGGVAYVGASLSAAGEVHHHNRLSGIAFGELKGGISARTTAVAAEFAGTQVDAPGSDNIRLDMWEKFVMISSMAGMNCLMRGNIGEIMATRDGETLMRDFLGECSSVAAASGFAPRPAYMTQIGTMLTTKGSVNNASMHHDLGGGRRTEADAIIGDMVARAGRFDLDTPLLRAAYCNLQVHEHRVAAQA